jgi:aryl-alcohol dehydrogenase-like predicted oxidoreductase/RimJ/RimL family protein N-acetyltransferase|tara:strand:+ start:7657 stop:9042 length:1386 start_codon:yes stop_codon:yes gene_type:complete
MKKQLKPYKKLETLKTRRFSLKKMKLKYVNNNYLSWFDDREIKKFIEYNPNKDLGNLRRNVKKTLKEKNVLFFGIFYKKKHIGNIKFEKIDFKKSSAYLGILIGDKEWQGKGVGSEIIEKICNQLFLTYKISKIFLGVQRKNLKALNLYSKNGFVIINKTNPKSYLMRRDYFINKLILGTAQFGSNYGIANKTGKISIKDIKKIKNLALKKGMVTIETAQAYKNSEKILGDASFTKFNFISKIPKIKNKNILNFNNLIHNSVKKSLKKLRLQKIYAFLFHNPIDLLSKNGKKIFSSLNELKRKGIIMNIGVAVYDVSELEALSKKFEFDIVSIPFNLLDRRFEKSNIVKKLKKKNVKFFARSIFLQGLLLMKKNNLPKYFDDWKKVFDKFENFTKKNKISKFKTCLSYALNSKIIDKTIVGVDDFYQFKQVINFCLNYKKVYLPNFGKIDYKLINPTQWKI